ncbi:hypothetical protein NQ317_007462 [Molorchus minor]|uniref:Cathepsin L n=1 Tax=Molorchus minor TaxID=1323400 RepID=A0ABQ9K3Z6_9CUCU|nr:hypothetical protein NQ317_007462 [Molorchus minor]
MQFRLFYPTALFLIIKAELSLVKAQYPTYHEVDKFSSHARPFASAKAFTNAATNAGIPRLPSLPVLNIPTQHLLQKEGATHIHQHRKPKVSVEDLVEEEWMEFKLAFNKIYPNADTENFRREIFIENRAKIARFNQEYSKGLRNFAARLNPFGDMLVHEFNQNVNGFNRTRGETLQNVTIPPATTFIRSANVIFPDNVDWRLVDAVSPVKSQQKCAGCWAFAAAGALEGHTYRKTRKLVEVSPQNLLDCTRPYGNDGCEGGLMNPSFQYVKDNGGVDGHEGYSFEAKEAECRFRRECCCNLFGTRTHRSPFGLTGEFVFINYQTFSGFVDIPPGDEQSLEIAVSTLGPVTAAIDASSDAFQFYSDGVYYNKECGNKPQQMNHAVLVVGYGVEPNGQKYWLVKNFLRTPMGHRGVHKNGQRCRKPLWDCHASQLSPSLIE